MFSRGLSELSWDLDFSWRTGLLQKMTNHILLLIVLVVIRWWPQIAKFWPSQNFPKRTTRVVSIPKIMKIYSGVWKILAKNTQKWLFWPKMSKFWPFLAILWVKKFFDRKNFWWSSKSYGDTTSCKKLEKNIERSRL